MSNIYDNFKANGVLGVSVFLGLFALGYLLSESLLQFKSLERSVTVKGLSQREYKANLVLWPIKFVSTGNDLSKLYSKIDSDTKDLLIFLEENGIQKKEITIEAPSVKDKLANEYAQTQTNFRYFSKRVINIYSSNIEVVQKARTKLGELGKKGIIFDSNEYESKVEYLFTDLNKVKPEMIEEATKQAREVALKFAKDSKSRLGKIKRASQGQFSIRNRDKNTQHIKKVRVVSTVEYYLAD